MNLSSMMYRLNHAQGQKLPLATEQQHHQQQQQQQQQQSPQQQQQQQQVIPSHILLQQQLDAAASSVAVAAAAAAAGSSGNHTLTLHAGNSTIDNNVFITNFSGVSGKETDNGSSSSNTQPRNLLHMSSQLQQHQTATRQLSNNVSNIVISAVDSLASASVEEKIKLLKTAIKSEPLHDISTAPMTPQSHSTAISNVLSDSCKEELINLAASTALAGVVPSSSAAALKGNLSLKSAAGIQSNLNPAQATQVTITTASGSGGSGGGSSTATAAIVGGGGGCGGSGAVADAVTSANGSLVFVPSKRARLELREEWISTPSPGSVPSTAPLSPSSASQNHMYGANLSNGYASPMSAGSYDPFSPNGKQGK